MIPDYPEIKPEQLDFSGPAGPCVIRWDRRGEPEKRDLLARLLPDVAEFHTSGTTGQARTWRRTGEQLLAEVELLADLLRPDRPQALLSFAPPQHLWGALTTVLLPAVLGLPVWYRPQFTIRPPQSSLTRWAVIAIPWSFPILRRELGWARQAEQLSVLYSTAMLPGTAREFADEAGADITEVFGSTETGGVATRRIGEEAWTLFDDVEFAGRGTTEARLAVHSPRLAADLTSWELDDYVEHVDYRRFLFRGRRSSLVNVNGRRFDLDSLEDSFRALINCRDLACVPVADELRGEHFDLLLVPHDHLRPPDLDKAFAHVEIRPREVRTVAAIERSGNGKARRLRDAHAQ